MRAVQRQLPPSMSELEKAQAKIALLEMNFNKERSKVRRLKRENDQLKDMQRVYSQLKRRQSISRERKASRGRSSTPYRELSANAKTKRITRTIEDLHEGYDDEEFCEIIKRISTRVMKLSVYETIHIMQELSLPYRKQRILRGRLSQLGRSIFASEAACRKKLRELEVSYEMEVNKVPYDKREYNVIQVKSVYEILKSRLDRMVEHGTFKEIQEFEQSVFVCFLIDKGGLTTKLGMVLGNKSGKINSIHNLSLLAQYEGEEKASVLHACFRNIANQIDTLEAIELRNGKTYTIEKFLGGDLKLQSSCYGLMAGKPKFYCIRCFTSETGTYEEFDKNAVYKKRTDWFDESNKFNKERKPLFATIATSNFIIPFLHIFLTLGADVINVMRTQALKLDIKSISDEKLEQKLQQLSKNKELRELQKEHEKTTQEIKSQLELYDTVQLILSHILQRKNVDEELSETCDSDSCFVQHLNINLPGRINGKDYIACNSCKSCYHSYCELLPLEATHVDKYKCQECSNQGILLLSLTRKINRLIELLNDDANRRQTVVNTKHAKIENLKDQMKEIVVALESMGTETNNLQKILDRYAITPANFWQEYTGNMIRRILEKADQIYNCLSEPMKESEHVKSAVQALKYMRDIQDLTESRMLENAEIQTFSDALNRLLNHFIEKMPYLRIKWKGHVLFRHALEFTTHHRNAQLFSEQPIEACHLYVENMNSRTTARDPNLRIMNTMRWLFHRNATFDCMEMPEKKKKPSAADHVEQAPSRESSIAGGSDVSMVSATSPASIMDLESVGNMESEFESSEEEEEYDSLSD
uniref:Zinc finger PHD-type domain-containing protein n=1 Tax=Acrobeloides nanus TaxID=290746 RepID=A0A914E9Q1_9BILA